MRRSLLAMPFFAIVATACGNEPPSDVCSGASCVDANGLFDIADVPVDRIARDVPTLDNSPRQDVVIGMDAADGYDVMFSDTQEDVPPDFGTFDTGVRDTGRVDVPTDRGTTPGCVSGAPGNVAVRFSYLPTGDGSAATVRYETDELPDRSTFLVGSTTSSTRSAVIADSASGGGLDLENGGAITVDISTVGVSTIRSVALAVYGRSFTSGTSGSFSWEGPFGMGDSPINAVSSITPYAWYRTDTGFTLTSPDNSMFRVQIFPGATSRSLIVNRVEICFDVL